jgi:hypothetical protein
MKITRRRFLGSAAAAATFTIVPRHVLGGSGHTPPSEKLNIASIGIAGMGGSDVGQFSRENIVALCDVDWKHAAGTFQKHPSARKYRDFRKMLDATTSTPSPRWRPSSGANTSIARSPSVTTSTKCDNSHSPPASMAS